MTNAKTTKRALFMSVMAMILCFAMLLGTTYAWFTDSVTSAGNVIKSGTLDISFEWLMGKDDPTADNAAWKDASTGAIFNSELWEPGYTEVRHIKVENEGTLALKYKMMIKANGTVSALADVIDVYYIDPATGPVSDRATFSNTNKLGTLAEFIKGIETTTAGNLLAGEKDVITLALKMREEAGNEYQNLSIGTDFSIVLVATQLTHENDSFDNKYDTDAEFIPAWDGSVGTVPPEDNGVITITTAAELAAFAQSVNGNARSRATANSYAGKTIVLGADINLGGEAWTPIGACNGPTYFQGTFDGNGYTIYNLSVDKSTDGYMHSTAGFFGWIDTGSAVIKNVNFVNASVKGSHWVGVVAGYMTGTIENCNVINSSVVGIYVNDDADGDKIGGLVGYLNKGALNNNTVKGTVVSGKRDIGGLVGSVAAGNTLKANKVADTTVVYTTEKSYASGGTIVSGRTGFVPDASNVAENVIVQKGTMVADGVVNTEKKNYQVITKQGFMELDSVLAAADPGEGKSATIDLLTDIDLAGEIWTPINRMWVTFNGNGHTISNMTTAAVRKAGLFGYAGAVTINDLTIENANVTGSQAGIFAGSGEALTAKNCVLKGENTVTFTATEETWNGIGAITGVIQYSTLNVNIAEGTTVTINYGDMTTAEKCVYVDALTGYATANLGTVTNNGTIKTSSVVSTSEQLKAAIETGASVVYLKDGDYALRFTNNVNYNVDDMTIVGLNDGAKLSISSSEVWYGRIQGSNVTFENIIFDGTVGTTGTATYNNCTFTGQLECGISNKANTYINNCTLNMLHTSTDMSAGDVYIKDSTITKAEYSGTATMNFKKCTIGELISWNMDTVLTGCTVTTLDDSHMTTGKITVNP